MKAFEVTYGNMNAFGSGMRVEEDITVLAETLNEALVKAEDALEKVKSGIFKACENFRTTEVNKDRVENLRVIGIREKTVLIENEDSLVNDLITAMANDLQEDE